MIVPLLASIKRTLGADRVRVSPVFLLSSAFFAAFWEIPASYVIGADCAVSDSSGVHASCRARTVSYTHLGKIPGGFNKREGKASENAIDVYKRQA